VRRVVEVAIDDVEEAALCFVPELPDEAFQHPTGKVAIMRVAGEVVHHAQRVMPERLYLDGLSLARRVSWTPGSPTGRSPSAW
jgi:hypothetical protein